MRDKNGQLWLPGFFTSEVKKVPVKKVKLTPEFYEELAQYIGDGTITIQELKEYIGPGIAVYNVIDYLSINYTLYDVDRGIYAMARPVKKRK